MEKTQNNDMSTEGYYVTLNGKFITDGKDPLSLKEAINIFNSIKEITLKSDAEACVGFSTIVSSKVIVEIVSAEFLVARMKSRNETPDHPIYPSTPNIPVPKP